MLYVPSLLLTIVNFLLEGVWLARFKFIFDPLAVIAYEVFTMEYK